MQVDAKISQIRSGDEGGKYAYLNVSDVDGGIEAWGSSYGHPTYLWQHQDEFHLVQFEDQAWADEWLQDHPDARSLRVPA